MEFRIAEKLKKVSVGNKNIIWEVFIHIGLYWGALALAYNAYKAYKKGYDYLASYMGYRITSYFMDYIEYAPLSKVLRKTIVDNFPWIIITFCLIYLLHKIGRSGRIVSLSYWRWFSILLFQALITNISFSHLGLGREMFIILILSLLFFVIFLILWTWSVKLLTPAFTFIKNDGLIKIIAISEKNYVVVIIGLFIYTILVSYASIPLYQWPLVFGILFVSSGVYLLLATEILKNIHIKMAMVLSSYAIVAGIVYYPIIHNIFRSDYWFMAILFNQAELSLDSIKKIAFFEMFGDTRFQPLAHLLMFVRYLILGHESFLYNILNIVLHATVGFAIFIILFKLLRNIQYSFIFGMLFIVLPSQFDTVAWTYHIYIIVGTLTVLIAFILTYRYAKTGKHVYLFVAILFSIFSIFLYEPFIFAPATLLLIVSGFYFSKEEAIPKKRFIFAIIGVAFSYIIYLSITVYGLNTWVNQSQRMSLKNILTIMHITKTIKAVSINLLESTFLKNIGLILDVNIRDIVYLYLPQRMLTNIVTLPKITLGLFILSLFRFRRENSNLVLPFVFLAISYLFVVFMGRLLTNDLSYVTSQPRYQYFPNALLLIAAGILLWTMYKRKQFRAIIIVSIMVIYFWNVQGVLNANNKVALAMKPMDTHYNRIRGFIASHPTAKLFLNFIPYTYERLFLGSDVALPILFKDRITVSLEKATHIYDGSSFKENSMNSDAKRSPYLKDFSIEWMYMHPSHVLRKREIEILGSDKAYPKVSLLPEFIKVEMVDANTGKVDVYKIKYQYYSKDEGDSYLNRWASMAVEKNSKELCFIYNGILQSKFELKSTYKGWDKDNADILGGYYMGSGEPVYIGRLFIQTDGAKYRCGSYQKGDKIDVDIKKPW